MAVDAWTPSRRLQNAAVAERQRLEREKRRVDQRVVALQRELAEAQAAQANLAERAKVLAVLTQGAADAAPDGFAAEPRSNGVANAHAGGNDAGPVDAHRAPTVPRAAREALRGARIRAVAARVLAESPRAHSAVHYRDWYALVVNAGFVVAGKDPEATFLTQLGRSPVVRRSTQAGVYELDFEFVPRAREQLRRLRQHLQATHDLADAASANELEAARVRRFALHDEIDTLERQLQEAMETLGDNPRSEEPTTDRAQP